MNSVHKHMEKSGNDGFKLDFLCDKTILIEIKTLFREEFILHYSYVLRVLSEMITNQNQATIFLVDGGPVRILLHSEFVYAVRPRDVTNKFDHCFYE